MKKSAVPPNHASWLRRFGLSAGTVFRMATRLRSGGTANIAGSRPMNSFGEAVAITRWMRGKWAMPESAATAHGPVRSTKVF